MPTPDMVQAVVDASLDTWKRQLLDLTRRNRALNFRALKVSTAAVVNEQPAEIYRLLYDEERALTFAAAPERPVGSTARQQSDTSTTSTDAAGADDPFDDAEHATEGRAFEPYAPDSLSATHLDSALPTTYSNATRCHWRRSSRTPSLSNRRCTKTIS